jgi:NitT/TauT family transport system permease protein
MTATWVRRVLPPLAPLLVAMLGVEIAVAAGWISDYLLPPPSQVFAALRLSGGELFAALWATTLAATLGLAMATAAGIGIAVAMSAARVVQRALYPYAVFFQTVPIIAIAPLLVIWFGYGLPTVVASAFIVSIFPVIANTFTGLRSTDPALRDMFRLYGASRLATMLKLQLPSALPSLFTGLRIAAGLAVIGAIVGEFIAGGGLGGIVDVARTQQRTDKVFAAVLLASLLGLAMFTLVNVASALTLRRWHASERGG